MLSSAEKEELPPGDPELHHQISKGTKFRFNIATYRKENQGDPALDVRSSVPSSIQVYLLIESL